MRSRTDVHCSPDFEYVQCLWWSRKWWLSDIDGHSARRKALLSSVILGRDYPLLAVVAQCSSLDLNMCNVPRAHNSCTLQACSSRLVLTSRCCPSYVLCSFSCLPHLPMLVLLSSSSFFSSAFAGYIHDNHLRPMHKELRVRSMVGTASEGRVVKQSCH